MFTYTVYLILYLPLLIFSLWISKEKVIKDEPTFLEYAIAVLVLLTVWGEIAIHLNQWVFPNGVNLGIYLGNHPLETYIQGLMLPLFIVSIWEFVKRFK